MRRTRVVLLDLDHWDAFASFGAALRRRGIDVVRVAPPRSGPSAPVGRWLDRLVFGPGSRDAADRAAAARALRDLVVVPTADVLGPEDVVEELRDEVPWCEHPVAARVSCADHARLLFDKLAMTRFAASLPVPVPLTWEQRPDSAPVVVKGRSGAGGRTVRVARTLAQADAAVEQLTPLAPRGLFFQEVVDGVLINVGGVADRGHVVVSCSYRAMPAVDDPLGPAELVEVVDCPGISRAMPPLLAALGYSGMFCVDYIVRPDGSAVLIDFNPRVFGAWLALQTAGTDLLGAYVDILEGRAARSGPLPDDHTRWRVRLLPRAGAESWRQWAGRACRSAHDLRRVVPITGHAFVTAMALRASVVSARDALRLLGSRRPPG